MAELFGDSLPEGCFHLAGFLLPERQARLVAAARAVARQAPLGQPTMRGDTPFKLRLTNCGAWGWWAERGQYAYRPAHPATRQPWPPMPPVILQAAQEAAEACGWNNFRPDACLINFYEAEEGSLGEHQDLSEADRASPIVTLSLGDTALFTARRDKSRRPAQVFLASGDVFVMGGPSRAAWHAVVSVLQNTSGLLRNGGRISLTLRRHGVKT